MHSDSYFTIGADHKVCEDYALAGKIGEQSFAILADGCSSSAYTDIGSRLLVLSAIKILKNSKNISKADMLSAINVASAAASVLELNDSCLDATLMIATEKEEEIHVLASGDGVIVADYENKIKIINIEFESGAPYYLSYTLDESRNKLYESQYKLDKTIDYNTVFKDNNAVTVEIHESQDIGIEHIIFDKKDIKSISIFSDGLTSFDFENDDLYLEFVKSLVSFKSLKGEFVKRRCRKAIKEVNKSQITHSDDLSMATLIKV
jgi:hypothetical protein